MTTKISEKIVCPIRGGTSSRYAEERAVALAEERGAEVIFVHIVDPSLAQRIERPLSEAVLEELEHIGESFLCIAVERAHARDAKAERVVLHGPVASTLEKFLRESRASVLVIGSPDHDAEHGTFSQDQFDRFIERLRTTLSIEIQVV
jgi:nucleotide-binding universal stress UspA family protein